MTQVLTDVTHLLTSGVVPLQELPAIVSGPLGKLLVALVVVALVLVVGRFVLNMAWRLVKIGIVVVALVWLVSVVLPELGV